MADFLNLLNEFATEVFDWKIFCGIIAAVLVFIMEVKLDHKYKPRNRRKEKAIEMGHVVRAKRMKKWDDDTSGYSVNSWLHATYVYEVDGKSYKYNYMGKVSPPLMIDLYYLNNPKRAFMGTAKKSSLISLIELLLPIVIGVAVANFLNYIIR